MRSPDVIDHLTPNEHALCKNVLMLHDILPCLWCCLEQLKCDLNIFSNIKIILGKQFYYKHEQKAVILNRFGLVCRLLDGSSAQAGY
jgi:hypothetical protein